MALIGRPNRLSVLRETSSGFFLDGGTHGDILLPGRYIPRGAAPGDMLEVFVYRDSEDRLVATTETPYAMVGEFGYLQVVSVNPQVGVFLDWGLEKDLLMPLRERPSSPLRPGQWLVVRVALDARTDRVIASARLNRWLDLTPPSYTEGQRVSVIIAGETPLGYTAIIENAHRGLLYRSDLAAPLSLGTSHGAYVRALRPDGKIDLALDRAGFRRIAPLAEEIMAALQAAGGFLPLHDDSSPEEIRAELGISKKAFKQAIGSLYRAKQILIEPTGIRRVVSAAPATPEPRVERPIFTPQRRGSRGRSGE